MADNKELGPASGGGEGATGPAAHTGGGDSGAGGGPAAHTGGGDSGAGGGPAAHTGGGDRITIFVNNTEYQVDGPSMTGADLKRLAGEPMNRMVIWIKGGPHAGPGGDGETVLDDQSVNLVGGMRFRIVNAGTFGGTLNRIKMPGAGRPPPPARAMPRRPGEAP